MKTFLTLFFLLISQLAVSQDFLNQTRKQVMEQMKQIAPHYVPTKDTIIRSSQIQIREFVLDDFKKTPPNGIISYIFYFENANIDQCTSIRMLILEKEKLDQTIRALDQSARRVSQSMWVDDLRNVTLQLFVFTKDDMTLYFFDIKR